MFLILEKIKKPCNRLKFIRNKCFGIFWLKNIKTGLDFGLYDHTLDEYILITANTPVLQYTIKYFKALE